MLEVNLFAEDTGHDAFLSGLLDRLADDFRLPIHLNHRSVTGGHGTAITELRRYIRDLARGVERIPDILVVAIDANCHGYVDRRGEIHAVLGQYAGWAVCAIPDPHVERWLLLDSAAFRRVLGMGCAAPDQKCNRDRYKYLLANAVREAGIEPILGGLEYANDIVREMNLERVRRSDASFDHLMEDLITAFQRF